MDWKPIETAPRDGRELFLKGTRFRSYIVIEIVGFYETGGYTEGWVTRDGVWFYPTFWREILDSPSVIE